MKEQNLILKDQLIILSEGAYSDYGVITIGKAIEDIDIKTLTNEYLEIHPEQKEEYHFSEDKFVKWLVIDKGLIEELPYVEWHVADYGSAEEMRLIVEEEEEC